MLIHNLTIKPIYIIIILIITNIFNIISLFRKFLRYDLILRKFLLSIMISEIVYVLYFVLIFLKNIFDKDLLMIDNFFFGLVNIVKIIEIVY